MIKFHFDLIIGMKTGVLTVPTTQTSVWQKATRQKMGAAYQERQERIASTTLARKIHRVLTIPTPA
ncbi:hypothetical protein J7384_09725 [Endozoicomonas sp. G2_1]|uniref:hypothetical protein n=1 Tax=Endozoicomonas sp. G2_1 TaxID=2821091 RepID=UPI001AD98985|nr:hypothetical protein [Endozoicomonas sp. G2_1]MBO9490641.1 hypothetical protein [Endozoicomonas sp. G2_1]